MSRGIVIYRPHVVCSLGESGNEFRKSGPVAGIAMFFFLTLKYKMCEINEIGTGCGLDRIGCVHCYKAESWATARVTQNIAYHFNICHALGYGSPKFTMNLLFIYAL